MTQVVCQAKDCKFNKDKICTLSCIELDESDMQWKDCGQATPIAEQTEPSTDCGWK